MGTKIKNINDKKLTTRKIMKTVMNDFSKIIDQAKNLQSKMRESQEKIKKIEVRLLFAAFRTKMRKEK